MYTAVLQLFFWAKTEKSMRARMLVCVHLCVCIHMYIYIRVCVLSSVTVADEMSVKCTATLGETDTHSLLCRGGNWGTGGQVSVGTSGSLSPQPLPLPTRRHSLITESLTWDINVNSLEILYSWEKKFRQRSQRREKQKKKQTPGQGHTYRIRMSEVTFP